MSSYFQNLAVEEYSISNQSPYGVDVIFSNYLFRANKQNYFKIFLQITPTIRHPQILNALHQHSIKNLVLKLYSKTRTEIIELKLQNSLLTNFEFQTAFSWPLLEFHWIPKDFDLTDQQFIYTFSHLHNLQNYQNQGAIHIKLSPITSDSVVNQVLLMRYQQYSLEAKQYFYCSNLVTMTSKIELFNFIPERRYYEIGIIKTHYQVEQKLWLFNYPLIQNLVNIIIKDLYGTQVQIKKVSLVGVNDLQSSIKKWFFEVYQKSRIFLITNHNRIALQGHKLVDDDQKPKGLLFLNTGSLQYLILTLVINNQEVIVSQTIFPKKEQVVDYQEFNFKNLPKFKYHFNDQFWKTFLITKTEMELEKLFKKYEVI
ncbi:hypothetical protein [Mesoplasma seiffertii]|uniref:hypothetical protein n=1 Tax=Mesoplasma seiffertii TaxID=28224 RepID=UPI00047BF744|nr:hypothetical protein [Mesoplasma seiffertii]